METENSFTNIQETVMDAKANMNSYVDRIGWKVLDTGSGRHSHKRLERANFITMDYQPIEGLVLMGNVHLMPFADNSFNAVFCNGVLEHVENPLKVCQEIYRILLPEGLVFVTVPFVWKEHPTPADYWRFTRYGCWHLLNQAGFVGIEIHSSGGYFQSLNCLLDKFGDKLMGRKLGKIYRLLYKPVGFALYCLDMIIKRPEFSIGHSVYGHKLASEGAQ